MPPAVDALVLAAGRSRRFGSDKRRAQLDDGTPMLLATVRRYLEVFDRVIVTLRAEGDAALATTLQREGDVRTVFSMRAAEGMGGSLADGVQAVRPGAAIAVALADMPWVRPSTLARLRAEAAVLPAGDWIVLPRLQDRDGHPVLFGPALREALGACRGDRGARAVIDHAERVRRIPTDDAGVLQDADDPETLARRTSD
ncbi:MAG: nucleotidyltransferase family protein [Pseudomonadales bacterium]|jgi:molybdenum cofactor cytidylyltransferase|nr:nucleotidyltransferase family protein [Pseudomonadales bacterium]